MYDKMTIMIPITIFALWVVFIIFLVQYMGLYLYNYKVRETCIEIALFGKVPLKRMKFNNITEIRKTSFKETLPWKSSEMYFALRFGNRVWGNMVLVRQKKALIKTILISPDNPDRFIHEVLQRLPRLEEGRNHKNSPEVKTIK
jgi:hypothetical protein